MAFHQKEKRNPPFVIGAEGSGVIIEMGTEVKGFSVGDAVMFSLGSIGNTEKGSLLLFLNKCVVCRYFC